VRLAVLSLCALALCCLCACGDTLQAKPVPHNILENMIASPFPVYWAGGTFRRLQITDATHDPSGAYSVQYGNCLEGGQGTCVPPLRIVTSPDNSFLPGDPGPRSQIPVREVQAVLARGGRTIVISTGGVVVDIYARDARLARAAAETVVPINAPGSPQARLAPALADTGFGEKPLPSQTPARLGLR
jgi:hypothetical protein